MLAHAMLSIPATKGFEIGAGFEAISMRGSAHNDCFVTGSKDGGLLRTETNRSGGVQVLTYHPSTDGDGQFGWNFEIPTVFKSSL